MHYVEGQNFSRTNLRKWATVTGLIPFEKHVQQIYINLISYIKCYHCLKGVTDVNQEKIGKSKQIPSKQETNFHEL